MIITMNLIDPPYLSFCRKCYWINLGVLSNIEALEASKACDDWWHRRDTWWSESKVEDHLKRCSGKVKKDKKEYPYPVCSIAVHPYLDLKRRFKHVR